MRLQTSLIIRFDSECLNLADLIVHEDTNYHQKGLFKKPLRVCLDRQCAVITPDGGRTNEDTDVRIQAV